MAARCPHGARALGPGLRVAGRAASARSSFLLCEVQLITVRVVGRW